MPTALRAIDLCAGAGGWACAARGTGIQITHAFDRWPAAAMTYRINHPDTQVADADLFEAETQATIRGLKGQVDVVLGGIPCEWLSIIRNGWNPKTLPKPREIEEGRALLDAVLTLVEYLDPRWWCLEDVIGLRHELPPMTPYAVLNAHHWSAQRRKRLFVGHFPMPAKPKKKPGILADFLGPGPYRIGRRTWPRVIKRRECFDGTSCVPAFPAEKAPTVTGATSSRRDADLAVVDPSLPGGKRQMEWQEAARLQGFPSDYLFFGSPTDVARQIGQAIQIDLGHAILEAMCRHSRKAER